MLWLRKKDIVDGSIAAIEDNKEEGKQFLTSISKMFGAEQDSTAVRDAFSLRVPSRKSLGERILEYYR